MTTLNEALFAFYNDLMNQGLLSDTLVLQFSEFGRRITRERQPGHRPRGGERDVRHGRQRARRHLRHRAKPARAADNPTLENNSADVRYETDFRSVYARVIEDWLGASSVTILGGDFRAGAPAFL